MSEIISIIITSNQMHICHIYNNQTPIVHSLTRSGVQGFHRCLCILEVQNPAHSGNRVNSTCLCQYKKITCHQSIMPHNHNQMPNSIIIWITCKQVSSKNKFAQCAQERDVTYTPSWSKLCPEVSQYISAEIMCITVS
jgi:hypothetical protein